MAETNHRDDPERLKRELRAEIARCRRRINDNLNALKAETRRLTDWRIYARKLAIPAAGAALVAGYLIAPRGGRAQRYAERAAASEGPKSRLSLVGRMLWALAKPLLPRLAKSALGAVQARASARATETAQHPGSPRSRSGQPLGRYRMR